MLGGDNTNNLYNVKFKLILQRGRRMVICIASNYFVHVLTMHN